MKRFVAILLALNLGIPLSSFAAFKHVIPWTNRKPQVGVPLLTQDPLYQGLVLYLPFLEGGGGATANSASTTKGTFHGTSVWGPGQFGPAFNGNISNSTWIDVPNYSAIQINNNMTIALWIKPSAVTSVTLGMEKGNDPAGSVQYGFGWNTDSKLAWIQNNTFFATSSYLMVANTWQHIALVVSSAGSPTITYYVNGISQGTFAGPASTATGTNSLGIGSRGDNVGGFNFTGLMDDVRIYNRQLSQAEIQRLVSLPFSIFKPITITFLNPNPATSATNTPSQIFKSLFYKAVLR